MDAGEGLPRDLFIFPGDITDFGGHSALEHGASRGDFESFDVPVGFAGDEGHDLDLHAVRVGGGKGGRVAINE